MPTNMDDAERDAALATASNEASFSYRNEESDDDYVEAELYRTPDGRAFRLVTMSGFDSPYMGATNAGEWLAAEEEARWSDFGQGEEPNINNVS